MVEAANRHKDPTMHRTPSTTKAFAAQNVSGVEEEKPSYTAHQFRNRHRLLLVSLLSAVPKASPS